MSPMVLIEQVLDACTESRLDWNSIDPGVYSNYGHCKLCYFYGNL